MKLVYATGNPGKFEEVKKFFDGIHIPIHSPREFGVVVDIEEDGKTYQENAVKKAETYSAKLGKDYAVIGDDTGVEIAALKGQPGIHTRRWNGSVMTDQEIIDYCIQLLSKVPSTDREAAMKTVIAVAHANKPTQCFEGILPGVIVDKPIELRIAGFPFESIFLASDYDLMLGVVHQISIQEKLKKNILTHRERAIISALPYLKGLLDI